MKNRSTLKRVIIVLSVFLFSEVGFLILQVNSGTAAYARNLDLGNKYLLSEDYDSAISAFSKAIEIDAMNADAYIGRGDAYKAKGDFEKAWDDYEKAQELSGNTSILRDKIGQTDITVVFEDGEGVDGATIKLNGNNHSYEFLTDSTGHIAEVVFPEEYNVEVTKADYESATTVLSAEKGGIEAGQIQLHGKSDINPHNEADENVFMGIITLNESVMSEVKTTSQGSTYRIKYDSSDNEEFVDLNLSVNDNNETFRLNPADYPAIEAVYVADIDISDSYSNIIVVVLGIDEVIETYLFAFDDDEILLMTELKGQLVPESITGNGKLLLEYWIGMQIRDYGSFTVRPEIIVHDLSAQQVAIHSGATVYSESGHSYKEGYQVPLTSELVVYSDASCSSITGTIPAGNSVDCAYVEYEKFTDRLYINAGEIEGYTTLQMLSRACGSVMLGA